MSNADSISYRGLDPDLPSIAALAAAEADDLISHRQTQVQNLKRLAEVLTTSFEDTGQTGIRRFLDPVSATIITNTARDASSANMNTYDDLAKFSLSLAHEMNIAANTSADELLKTIKNFCLALSRYSLASKEPSDSMANIPDYKR